LVGRKVPGHQENFPERRRWLRHKVHTPAFASFDGVTGGVILDLSEQGMAMHTASPLEPQRRISLHLSLPEPATYLDTTGYVAWADALGRAGVRFSDLPQEGRLRLKQWLTANDAAPSRKAPKFTVGEFSLSALTANPGAKPAREPLALSLEPEASAPEKKGLQLASTTVQYEFNPLGSDLNVALRLISERARSLTRGTGAAIALAHNGSMVCRASVGTNVPALGTRLDADSGFSGECIRSAKALRCDDAETDPRVNAESCQRLGLRSILAAPVKYERRVIGILEVFATQPFAFDEGDVAVVERLAQTVLQTMGRIAPIKRG
jgi:putative methionine-R-sulfoxide reductase with GAF domain